MKIVISNDHSAVWLKNEIKEYLRNLGHEVLDYGAQTPERCNYAVYGKKAAQAVADGVADKGIVICGTGIGISIAANKVRGIRCAVCSEPVSARLSREHNDANMIAFGARIIGVEMAKNIVSVWLDAEFAGGIHLERVGCIE